jgi:ADP-heptose:LPS heptosyltransferase
MLQGFSDALVMAVTRPWVGASSTIFSRLRSKLSYHNVSWQMRLLPRRKLLDLNQTLSRVRKILVITPPHPWQMFHANLTITALKDAFSQAEVFAVATPATVDILESSRLVDEIVGEISTRSHPRSRKLQKLSRTIQSYNFDLAVNLNLEPDLAGLYLIYRSQAVIRVGFRPARLPSPYNIVVIPSEDIIYEADRYLKLVMPLGIKTDRNPLTWSVTKKEREAAGRKLRSLGVRQADSLIAIDCTADQEDRRFTPEQIQSLSDDLSDKLKARSLIFVDADAGRLSPEAEELDAPAEIPLPDTAHYLVHCRAMITTNTNLFHMGQALKIPSVLLFKSNDIRRWIPEKLENLERIPIEDLSSIPIDQVVRATERLITEPV